MQGRDPWMKSHTHRKQFTCCWWVSNATCTLQPSTSINIFTDTKSIKSQNCTLLEYNWSISTLLFVTWYLLCLEGALRRPMHTEVCIGLDITHFPSLMYGFIMQQAYIIIIPGILYTLTIALVCTYVAQNQTWGQRPSHASFSTCEC